VGHLIFAYLLYQIIAQRGAKPDGPTYFRSVPEGLFQSESSEPSARPTTTQ